MSPTQQDPNNRLAIIAGSGVLPHHVAAAARATGDEPFILPIENQAGGDWSTYAHHWLGIGDFRGLKELFRRQNIGRLVMSGGVNQRPALKEIRPTLSTLSKLPSVLRTLLSGGDNKVLTMVIDLVEAEGVRVIGVQDVVPDLLARQGSLGTHTPDADDWRDIAVGVEASLALGKLDIGQSAVVVGGRVVALEGPEGTDEMLKRVASLRASGRLSSRSKGVLIKLCKPQQDMRVDLPSAGLSTLEAALATGLSGVALEAGRSLLLQESDAIAFADANGLFIEGILPAPEPLSERPR